MARYKRFHLSVLPSPSAFALWSPPLAHLILQAISGQLFFVFPFLEPPEVPQHTAVLVHFGKRFFCPKAFETLEEWLVFELSHGYRSCRSADSSL